MPDDGVPVGDDDRVEAARKPLSDAAGPPRVLRDMEDIFGKPSGTRPKTAATGPHPIGPVVGPRNRRTPRTISPPMLLLGGLVMGGSLAWLVLSPPTPTAQPVARQVERSYELPPLPPRRVEPAPITPLPVASPLPPAPAAETAAYAPAGVGAGTRTGATRSRSVVAAANPGRAIGAQRRIARRRPAANSEEPCGDRGGLARARCMRPEILAADRRLRDAYGDAVRAGVDRRVLVSLRNRWARVSDKAVSDPDYVADNFQRMAQRLDAERAAAAAAEY